jgi:hypothetical protein
MYGALKAAGESLIRSFAIRGNSLGKGCFISIRLGFVSYNTNENLNDRHPSFQAAQILLAKRKLPNWTDVAQSVLSLSFQGNSILNGSVIWADYGVHLIEQTEILTDSIELRNR